MQTRKTRVVTLIERAGARRSKEVLQSGQCSAHTDEIAGL
jgi:hypothetical protein